MYAYNKKRKSKPWLLRRACQSFGLPPSLYTIIGRTWGRALILSTMLTMLASGFVSFVDAPYIFLEKVYHHNYLIKHIKILCWMFPFVYLYINENNRARIYCKIMRDNPHLADAFFYQRIRDLINSWFLFSSIDVEWYWFCVDDKKRGTVHAHGCLSLNCNSGT